MRGSLSALAHARRAQVILVEAAHKLFSNGTERFLTAVQREVCARVIEFSVNIINTSRANAHRGRHTHQAEKPRCGN